MNSANRWAYYRMTGYVATIAMHAVNSSVMLGNFTEEAMVDPNIRLFSKFMFIFLTCWNFLAQMIHATLGLSCDLLSLTIGDQYKFLGRLKQARDLLFAGFVVPYTFLVVGCFWPLFLYDRELILPYYTTKIVNSLSNHIIHSAILLVVLWELYFQPRQPPSTHKQNISLMMGVSWIYLAVIFKAYYVYGAFPYPLMTSLYGSIYFVAFIAFVLSSLPIGYYGQWRLTRKIWNQNVKNKDC